MSFYQVPEYIFNPIGTRKIVHGSVLLPTDFNGDLSNQLTSYGIKDIENAQHESDLVDINWWAKQKDKFDWLVLISQGLGETSEWILDYGPHCARKGLCVLDRVTFLEPTKRREKFLKNHDLTNLIILSPRPQFRADGKTQKDSVTSAWFVFQPKGTATGYTKVEFEVGWQRPSLI